MKSKSKIFMFALSLIALLFCVAAQKDASPIVVGKQVFYTSDMDEGRSRQVTKYAAVISGLAMYFNTDTGRDEIVTDDDGHPLVHLQIFRPEYLGGSFDKDNVPYTGAVIPGTCRGVEASDRIGAKP